MPPLQKTFLECLLIVCPPFPFIHGKAGMTAKKTSLPQPVETVYTDDFAPLILVGKAAFRYGKSHISQWYPGIIAWIL